MGQFHSRTYDTYIEEVKAKRKYKFVTKTDMFKNIYAKTNIRIYNTNDGGKLCSRTTKNKRNSRKSP